MTYTITLSNGTTQINVADDAVNTSATSLTLVGRNASGYGQPIEADLVHILENWAASSAPVNPLLGQLWFNTQTSVLSVCTGLSPTVWTALANASSGGTVTSVINLSGNITLSQLQGAGLTTSTQLSAAIANLAPLASPSFSGIPLAPTPSGSTSGQIATVGYAQTLANNAQGAATTTSETFAATIVAALHARTVLTSNMSFFVSPTGSDSNNGAASGTPWQTLQHAWNTICTGYDLNGFGITIHLATGNYNAGVYMVGYPPGYSPSSSGIVWLGGSSNPASTVITAVDTPCFNAGAGCLSVTVQNMKLITSGNQTSPFNPNQTIYCQRGGAIYFNNIDFGTSTGYHIYVELGGYVECGSSATTGTVYSISGNAVGHIFCAAESTVVIENTTITIANNPHWSVVFLICQSATVFYNGNHITGPATGQKYSVNYDGVVFTEGTYSSLPGDTPGGTANGGVIQ